ncbi:MAG: DMT family transporter [Eubacteriales bacterium]|nr:DMT family transporter [Eubacteriales bacterium]
MSELDRASSLSLRPCAILLAVLCTLLWGSAIPIVKISSPLFGIATAFDRILFAGIRFTAAGLVTLLVARFCSPAMHPFHVSRAASLLGLGLVQTTAQYVCFYLGLAHALGTRTAILNTTSTFFAVFLAALFFPTERITLKKLIGCLVGFTGIVLANLGGAVGGAFSWNGDFLILLSSFFFALGSVISKRLSRKADPIRVAGAQLSLGGAVLLSIGLVGGGALRSINLQGLLLLLYLIFLSAAAFTIWTSLLRRYDAASVSVYFFLLPVFGVALSGLLLGERIALVQTLTALLFVCTGIVIVNRPAGKRRNVPPTPREIE